jgi:hypothetical protein
MEYFNDTVVSQCLKFYAIQPSQYRFLRGVGKKNRMKLAKYWEIIGQFV